MTDTINYLKGETWYAQEPTWVELKTIVNYLSKGLENFAQQEHIANEVH